MSSSHSLSLPMLRLLLLLLLFFSIRTKPYTLCSLFLSDVVFLFNSGLITELIWMDLSFHLEVVGSNLAY